MSITPNAATQTIATTCAIVGGGPAGMMLGLLLARAGVDVVVLEKHVDFLRDFRGDTVHPSTLEVMYELGLLEEFLKRPHQQVKELTGNVGGRAVTIADFSHLPTHCRFVALMPQWEFLNFVAENARKYPTFHLHMQAEAHALVKEHSRVTGVRARTPDGALVVKAALVVGADGRHSCIRTQAGLAVEDIGAPIDVLWMRISRQESDPQETGGYFDTGKVFVTLNRGDYWQCAFVIPKGGYDKVCQSGLPAFRESIAAIAPVFRDRLEELADWDQIRLLTVAIDRLTQWHRPGLLCIGDAAHAMSPIGGVGINLAIQDAVATANILAGPLARRTVTEHDLAKVQRRRTFPTKFTQGLQVLIQNHVITRVLGSSGEHMPLPWPMKLFARFPVLRRLPARVVGLGVRPEHVRTPEVRPAAKKPQ